MDTHAQSAVRDDPRRHEATNPLHGPRLVARSLLDRIHQQMAQDGRFRKIDLLAALGSIGGFSCVLAALNVAEAGQCRDGADLIIIETRDGSRFYSGNLTNAFLLESHDSLLALTYSAAGNQGAVLSQETVLDTFRHVAATIGDPQFGKPRLTDGDQPGALPISYVRRLWPIALHVLDMNHVPVRRRPLAIGMAIELAFAIDEQAIEPLLAAQIVTECAVPMAKIDPRKIA
ncbi:hypothetical protein [Rhizobium esperanzae]|uniref:Uncharacterized protein n=1 Tax=Rhizobium esperanzae TaxID=1967781 RepID=A0A7W6R0G7_9HYPH|nr:hypothetical protein [Rhizobium esperanzae]MBB4234336.1 hypothetical protein [Rhizobium esperanzae]